MFPVISVLFAEDKNWVVTADKSNEDCMPTVTDVAQNPPYRSRARVSCDCTAWEWTERSPSQGG